ncbi:glycerate kinase [Oscillibacter valericigenes]|uniref:glycerate kinase family protein n=1 Tax=Oscillibacter valericigenes TaxID=351091 RepID=UPI001F46B022|nr:glycerate kinase [Oscillibacter valericigenes]MCF2615610.1 glycerate kinase [Oscillibacter valericigenes]
MKKCIVISDSFKGTLSTLDICAIAREVFPAHFPDCELVTLPVADGGEGTVACFLEALQAQPVTVSISGPFGEPIQAVYARKNSLAVIEMASAAGLPLAGERRDPETATTYGVGQLIRHAVEQGCTDILLGLGGSATNDGGCGCAAALGTCFFDAAGNSFVPVGGTLADIAHIDVRERCRLLENVRVTVMCDVENPLFGPNGAAWVFGPQKGADDAMAARLDDGLRHLDAAFQQDLGLHLADLPGAGAAGGMGAGSIAFLGGTLRSGIEAVLDAVDFDRRLDGADLVITGEGRIDAQSVQGKVISGIARRTAPRNIPLVAIVGGIGPGAEAAYRLGLTAMFSINRAAESFAESAPRSAENYRRTLADLLRLIKAMET